MYLFVQFKFSVYGHTQTYTRVLQCSPPSVGLAQARPNKGPPVKQIQESAKFYASSKFHKLVSGILAAIDWCN